MKMPTCQRKIYLLVIVLMSVSFYGNHRAGSRYERSPPGYRPSFEVLEPTPLLQDPVGAGCAKGALCSAHATRSFPSRPVAVESLGPLQRDSTWSGTYRCIEYGEVFSASFLASMGIFKGIRRYDKVLKSHRAAHACHYLAWERSANKTVDVLDFFVEHLSAYERRLNFGAIRQRSQQAVREQVAAALSDRLRSYASDQFLARARRRLADPHGLLALIPYYGEVRLHFSSAMPPPERGFDFSVPTDEALPISPYVHPGHGGRSGSVVRAD